MALHNPRLPEMLPLGAISTTAGHRSASESAPAFGSAPRHEIETTLYGRPIGFVQEPFVPPLDPPSVLASCLCPAPLRDQFLELTVLGFAPKTVA